MKIGIVSFQRSLSYGAFFQCLALQNCLRAMGHEIEFIDYQPRHRQEKSGLVASKWLRYVRRFNIWRAVLMLGFRRASHAHLRIGSRRFDSLEALGAAGADFEAIVCGSDQIWNASHTGGAPDPAYFAAFAAPGVPRIAYAPSFGGSAIDSRHHPRLRDLAGAMHVLSVREPSGQHLIEQLLGRPCEQMPDPTLLWPEVAALAGARRRRAPFLLSFRLQTSELFDEVMHGVVLHHGERVVHVRDHEPPSVPGSAQCMPDPFDWLRLVRDCEHLVTNSFHGVMFALIFQRPFTAVALAGADGDRTERIRAVLELFGLSALLCRSPQNLPRAIEAAAAIDWPRVAAIRERERARAMAFLRMALAPVRESTPAALRPDIVLGDRAAAPHPT